MVAFDHMRLGLQDLDWAYQYLPIFAQAFTNDGEGDAEDEEAEQEPQPTSSLPLGRTAEAREKGPDAGPPIEASRARKRQRNEV
mmetsp:Transcript_10567/g.17730  ORF Transcript_10567/g.17730 Transcript_10567/m.17730 type:complete len:84 (+) Transcript_10567:1819-2070(+)